MTEKEKKILEEAIKIQQNQIERENYKESLRETLSHDNSQPFVVCKTTNALAVCGAKKDLDIMITPRVISKCMADESEHYHGHNLSQDIIENLPEQLSTPVMVFKGSKNKSLVVITDLEDEENKEILIAISLEDTIGFKEVNRVSSVYGKDNMSNYLNRQIVEHNLLAVNVEKANEMLHSAGVQFPMENTFISFNNSIAYTMENVKYPLTEKEKKFMDIDLASIIAKNSLAWDEITDIGYMMYSYNYRKEHIPSRIARYGLSGLPETELYSFLDRYEKGEDISKELVLGLSGLNVQNCIIDVGGLSIYPEKREETENGYKLTYGNVEREVTYKELEEAYIRLIKDEYNRVFREDELEQACSNIINYFENNAEGDSKTNTVKNIMNIKESVMLAYDYDRETDTTYSAYVDLDNNKLVRKYDQTIIERKYNSLDEMNHILLSNMSYDELLHPEPRALEQAIEYIADFCDEEYNTGNVSYKYPDKHDLHHVPLAYTDLTDFEIPIHAYADLVDYKIVKEFGGDIIEVNQYNSLKEMNEEALCCLDFSDLVYVDSEIEEKYEQMYKQASYDRGEALKNLQLSILEYDLELPMNLIKDQHYEFEDRYTIYLGGIDLNGHERKDNYEESTKTMDISISQEPYCANYIRLSSTENSNSAILYDPTKENELNEVKNQISNFIAKSDKLMIYKFIGNDNTGFFTSPEIIPFRKESVIGVLPNNDNVGDSDPDFTGLGNGIKR